MFTVVCPSCLAKFAAEESQGGRKAVCPQCSEGFLLPLPPPALKSPALVPTEPELPVINDRGDAAIPTSPRLTLCADCGHEVSPAALMCPRCGRPLRPQFAAFLTATIASMTGREVAPRTAAALVCVGLSAALAVAVVLTLLILR